MTGEGDIRDIFKDDERILIAAWLLPNEGQLTDGQRRQAMDNFERYARRHFLNYADVARQLGGTLKATTIGALVKGRFRGNADERVRRLNLWVEQHARQRATSLHKKFVSTKVAKDLLAVARLTFENKTIGLVCGPSGIGKSRCAQAVYEKYVGALYVRVITGYHHPKGLTHALAGELGVRQGHARNSGAKFQMQLERVIAVLRDSSRLLIVDEAHELQDVALRVLRDIHDTTGIPILLVATRDLHDRILKNADPDHGQLYSRCDVIHHLTEGHDVYSGGKPLYTVKDVLELYNEPPVRLSKDAADYLQGVANELGRGSLRRCEVLLRNAVRRARKRQGLPDGEPVTVTADDLAYVESILRRESSEQAAILSRRQRAAGLSTG